MATNKGSRPILPPEKQTSITNSSAAVDSALGMKSLAVAAAEAARQARNAPDPLSGERQDAEAVVAAFSAEVSKAIGSPVAIGEMQRGRLRERAAPSASPNSHVPQFDFVDVLFDRKKGSIDGFYALVKFSVSGQAARDGTLKAVKVFRADVSNEVVRPLATISMLGLSRISSSTSRKNANVLEMHERRLREANRTSALTTLLSVDPIDGNRQAASSTPVTPGESGNSRTKSKSDKALAGYLKPGEDIGSLDSSVASNLNFLRNIQRSRGVQAMMSPENVGSAVVDLDTRAKLQIRQTEALGKLPTAVGATIMQNANASGFRELGVFTFDAFKKTEVGGFLELSFEDVTVTFGKTYRYYIVSIDAGMNESLRSKIVSVTIAPTVAPASPAVSLITADRTGTSFVMLSSGSILPEKFEVYRRERFSERQEQSMQIRTSATKDGYTVGTETRDALSNGFIQVGEAQAGHDGSGIFNDRRVRAGRTYDYSFYSVDSFGNKSQTPTTVEAYISDPLRPRPLRAPSILAEPFPDGMKVSITNNDDKAVAVLLSRRNMTVDRSRFTTPSQPLRSILGRQRDPISRSSYVGQHVVNDGWTGTFMVSKDQQIIFNDRFSRRDMTYQYRVVAVDRFGNESSAAFSSPAMVTLDPKLEAPVGLAAAYDGSAVNLSWTDSNIDVDALDRIGSQDALADSAVRTLFQIERRPTGQDSWDRFPLVTGSMFSDPVRSDQHPSSRPPWPKKGAEYQYRVSLIQTGSFVSDFSQPVTVKVVDRVSAPVAVSIKASDTKVRPFYVSLGWSTPEKSGVVDKWEIERAVLNNIAAARINLKNRTEIESLKFKARASIGRESSRGLARSIDPSMRDVSTARAAAPGDHSFIDDDISFGNSYVYRLRAVGLDGITSQWIYRGVSVRDELFDAKLNSQITMKERVGLAASRAPLVRKKGR
jgi:hypothetical protein